MKKLLIFSDMDGTIDRASADDFVNFFELVYKYCEEKGYDDFSFNIVTGAFDNCRDLYREVFSYVKNKTGHDIKYDVFTRLKPEEKKDAIDYWVSFDAIQKDFEGEVPDNFLLAKEVIFFDDRPHESLKGDNGKEFFESKYDISFECVVPTRNIYSLIDYFSQQLTSGDKKGPYVKNNV